MTSKILGFDELLLNPIITMDNSVFGSLHSVAFFALPYFASEVSKADEELRDKVKDEFFRLTLRKSTKAGSELLGRFMKAKRHLVLTAWGVFQFKKGFLFASAGVVITYNLLILQLNTEIKR
ncbi:hypothetical protein AVEN_15524-1 [Araneus ventricosus]|uniref:Uncharacterized protein n=1 Tax=Araneus ventricosus TaxID=182803 RepID=A0A4Y2NK40_ARAVE|nr:hypothetical protein AVEN_15524-1 [Araneus ventricosus]